MPVKWYKEIPAWANQNATTPDGTNVTSSVSNNQYTVSNIAADVTVEVEFEAITHTLSITATGSGLSEEPSYCTSSPSRSASNRAACSSSNNGVPDTPRVVGRGGAMERYEDGHT